MRRTSRQVARYRNGNTALRWSATGFLEEQESFRKIQRVNDLWILRAVLGRPMKQVRVDEPKKAA